jgi:hypothetical protein
MKMINPIILKKISIMRVEELIPPTPIPVEFPIVVITLD